MNLKKIIALALCVCMVLSFFPVSVFAEDWEDEVVLVDEEEYFEPQDEYVEEEIIIEEPADYVEYVEPVEEIVVEDEDVLVEEESELIEEPAAEEPAAPAEEPAAAVTAELETAETFDGGFVASIAYVEDTTATKNYTSLGAAITEAGTLDQGSEMTLGTEVVLKANDTTAQTIDKNVTIRANADGLKIGAVTVTNGEVALDGVTVNGAVAVSGGNVALNGVTVTGAVAVSGGKLTVEGGALQATLTLSGGEAALNTTSTVTEQDAVVVSGSGKLTITGGTYDVVKAADGVTAGNVKGGTFGRIWKVLLADGYVAKDMSNANFGVGVVTQTDKEAMYGTGAGRKYFNLTEIPDGVETPKLLKDASFELTADKFSVILNGHTLTVDAGDGYYVDSSVDGVVTTYERKAAVAVIGEGTDAPKYYDSLAGAIAAAADGNVIKLLTDADNFAPDSANFSNITKSITIDLNQKTITPAKQNITVNNNASVIFQNGKINIVNHTDGNQEYVFGVTGYSGTKGTLTFKNIEFTGSDIKVGCGVFGSYNDKESVVNLENCTIDFTGLETDLFYGQTYGGAKNYINVTDTTINTTGVKSTLAYAGIITITNSTINFKTNGGSYGTVHHGEFTLDNTSLTIEPSDPATREEGKWIGINVAGNGGVVTIKNSSSVNVSGVAGIDGVKMTEGAELIQDDTSEFNLNNEPVFAGVAVINGEQYLTLAAAVSAAQGGETVTLLKDAELATTLTISKAIIIDGDGHSIKAVHGTVAGTRDDHFGCEELITSQDYASKAGRNIISISANAELRNLTVSSNGLYPRHLVSVVGGASATLTDVDLNQDSTTIRGANALHISDENSKATIKGALSFTLGERTWAAISFNKPNETLDLTACSGVTVTSDTRTAPQAFILTNQLTNEQVLGLEEAGFAPVSSTVGNQNGFEPVANNAKIGSAEAEGTVYNYKVGNEYFNTFSAAAAAAQAAGAGAYVDVFKAPAAGDTYTLTSGSLKVKLNGKVADINTIVKASGAAVLTVEGPDADGITTVSYNSNVVAFVNTTVDGANVRTYFTTFGAAAAFGIKNGRAIQVIAGATLDAEDDVKLAADQTLRVIWNGVDGASHIKAADPANYIVPHDEDEWGAVPYTVDVIGAQITDAEGNVKGNYSTFDDALSHAEANDVIVLKKDGTWSGEDATEVPAFKVTIDIGGTDNKLTIEGGHQFVNNSDVTIKNGNVFITGKTTTNGEKVSWGIFTDYYNGSTGTKLAFDNVTLTTAADIAGLIGFDNGLTLNIKDSDLTVNGATHFAFYTYGSNVIIDNSEVKVLNSLTAVKPNGWPAEGAFDYGTYNISDSKISVDGALNAAFYGINGTIADSEITASVQASTAEGAHINTKNNPGVFVQAESDNLTISNTTLSLTSGTGSAFAENNATDNAPILILNNATVTCGDGTVSGIVANVAVEEVTRSFTIFAEAAAYAFANDAVVDLQAAPAPTDTFKLTTGMLKVKLNDKVTGDAAIKALVTTDADKSVLVNKVEGITTYSLETRTINTSKLDGGVAVPRKWYDTMTEAVADLQSGEFIVITETKAYEFSKNDTVKAIYVKTSGDNVKFNPTVKESDIGYRVESRPDSNPTGSTRYEIVPNTFLVHFDANGGTGNMNDQTFTYDVQQALTANAYTNASAKFMGWATSQDDADVLKVTYADKESVKNLDPANNATVTLYAVWESEAYLIDKGDHTHYRGTIDDAIVYREEHVADGWFDADSPIYLNADNVTYHLDNAADTLTINLNGHGDTFKVTPEKVTIPSEYDPAVGITSNYYVVEPTTVDGMTTYSCAQYIAYVKTQPYTYTRNNDGTYTPVPGTATYMLYDTFANAADAAVNPTPEAVRPAEVKTVVLLQKNPVNYELASGSLSVDRGSPAKDCNVVAPTGKRLNMSDAGTVRTFTLVETVTVTFSMNGKTGTAPAALTIDKGAKATKPADASTTDGYTFTNWYANEAATGDPFDFDTPITADTTIFAGWEATPYTITYTGGAYTNPNANITTYTVETRDSITFEDAVSYGWHFDGWKLNGEMLQNGKIPAGTTGDIEVEATWSKVNYAVTFVTPEGVLTPDALSVPYNTKAEKPNDPVRDYYDFKGWYKHKTPEEGETAFDFDNTPITEATTLYAWYTPVEYTITYYLNGGSLAEGVTNPTKYTVETETFTLKNPTKANWTFDGWTGSNSQDPGQSTVTIAKGSHGDLTYGAHYKYTATFVMNGGTPAVPAQTNMERVLVTRPADDPTLADATFEGWYADAAFNNEFDFTTAPDGNVTIYAKFVGEPRSIVFMDDDYTHRIFKTYNVNVGDTLPAYAPDPLPTRTGYALDETDLWNPSIFDDQGNLKKVTTDQVFNLKWKQLFTVDFEVNGIVIKSIENVKAGDTIAENLAPYARKDGKDAKWLLDGELFGFDTTPVESNLTLVASWDDTPATSADFTYNMSLTENLNMNFYVRNVKDNIEDYTVKVSIDGEDDQFFYLDNAEENIFTIAEFDARRMTDKINVYVTDGDAVVLDKVYTIAGYCNAVIESTGNEKLKELANAILVYGANAQIALNYNTDNLPTDYYDVSGVVIPTATAKTKGSVTGVSKFGNQVMVDSNVTLRVLLQVDSTASIGDYTVTVNDTEVVPVKQSATIWYMDIPVSALKLGERQIVYVEDDNGMATYSLNTIVPIKRISNDLTKALYAYYDAATAYATSI